jgi:hypothetical protein
MATRATFFNLLLKHRYLELDAPISEGSLPKDAFCSILYIPVLDNNSILNCLEM